MNEREVQTWLEWHLNGEQKISGVGLCPIRFYLPHGFLVVMSRADKVPAGRVDCAANWGSLGLPDIKSMNATKSAGWEGLTDRARTPYRYANKLPAPLEAMIVSMRREQPTWGARKLRDRLLPLLQQQAKFDAFVYEFNNERPP
jgi:hypothetical protein